MSGKSHIEWTNATWNPVTGCTRVSAGCDNCYAVRHTRKLAGAAKGAVGQPGLRKVGERYVGLTVRNAKGDLHFNGEVRCHEDVLDWPLRQKKPLMIFVNSMSDLFHEKVPFDFIRQVYRVMEKCPQHTFQILTKRPERAVDFYGGTSGAGLTMPALRNVWLGTSIEDQESADHRIPHLLCCPAAVRFLSVEPMLGPIAFRHDDPYPYVVDLLAGTRAMPDHDDPDWDFGGSIVGGINWLICGGESGPGARPMHPDWARSVRDQCAAAGVPFFFKQWGEWAPLPETFRYTPKFGSGNREYVRALKAFSKKHSASVVIDDRSEGWDRQMIECGTCLNGGELAIGRVGKKRAGAMLDGKLHREWPTTTPEPAR